MYGADHVAGLVRGKVQGYADAFRCWLGSWTCQGHTGRTGACGMQDMPGT